MDLTSLLKSPKFTIGFSFVFLLGFILIGIAFILGNNFQGDVKGTSKNKISIKPQINIEDKFSECVEGDDPVTAEITNPDGGSYEFGTSVNLTGEVKFNCADYLSEDEFEIQVSWFLDDQKSPISENLTYTILNASVGDHKVSFEVEVRIDGSDNLSTGDIANFRVFEPEPVVITPPPNTPPTAIINSPANGTTVNAEYTGGCVAIINANGNGSDNEDGTLTGSSLSWRLVDPSGVSTNSGTGNTATIVIDTDYNSEPFLYKLYLKATDSGGLTNEKMVTVYLDTSYCG